jgi:MIP family channel proteins
VIASFERRFIVEILGTFGFLFIAFSGVALSVLNPSAIGSVGVAAAFGLGLGLMVFAFGHISGGHFNPAVSLGLAIGGAFPWREVLGYWLAQVVGACGAVAAALALYGEKVREAMVNVPADGIGNGTALGIEIIITALFLIVISSVATDDSPWSGAFAPVAIGGFIFIALAVAGPIDGGSYNPARAIAPALFAGEGSHLWIYIVGPLVGGIVGGLIYALVRLRPVNDEVEELTEA